MRQRIEHARELLADPGRRVAEVSFELGFPSQSHFTTVFRALVGLTPRAYQRHCNGKKGWQESEISHKSERPLQAVSDKIRLKSETTYSVGAIYLRAGSK
jgi:Helix-turn-helix domain